MHAISRVNGRLKLLYGAGGIADAVKTAQFSLFTLFFYTTVMGLPAQLVGLVSALGLLWDAVIDPVIGHASDTARSPLGRRHLWMLAGACTMGLSYFAFFSPPHHVSRPALFAWLLLTNLAVRTAVSAFAIPYLALGAELSEDYHERNSITAVRGGLGLLGTLAAAALPFVVFLPDRAAAVVNPRMNPEGYSRMGLAFGGLMTVAALVAVISTLKQRSTGGGFSNGAPEGSQRNLFADIAITLGNPSFRAMLIWYALCFFALVTNTGLALYYLTYCAQVSTSSALSTLQFTFYTAGIVGVIVWLRTAHKVEKRWFCLLTPLVLAGLAAMALLLVGEGKPLGTNNLPALMVGYALAGFFGSILWFIPASMIADIVDEDELSTKRRRQGSFFGVYSLSQQITASAAALTISLLVDRYAGLVPGQAAQSPQTMQRLAQLFAGIPLILLVLAATVMLRYRLSHQRLTEIQSALVQQRAER